mmetsp:Transcript_27550/g.31728  ORF Transcript_27550/g.31728 Transcript_27550/m.31728 type:complete len:83 (+) Transcript_27550:221-469(+)
MFEILPTNLSIMTIHLTFFIKFSIFESLGVKRQFSNTEGWHFLEMPCYSYFLDGNVYNILQCLPYQRIATFSRIGLQEKLPK